MARNVNDSLESTLSEGRGGDGRMDKPSKNVWGAHLFEGIKDKGSQKKIMTTKTNVLKKMDYKSMY